MTNQQFDEIKAFMMMMTFLVTIIAGILLLNRYL